MNQKIRCIRTHERIFNGSRITFYEGDFYDLIKIHGYYTISFSLYGKENQLNASELFFKKRFLLLSEWRDKQIDSILED